MSSISSVAPGNFEIEGLDTFVVSPEPNVYFVGFTCTPEQAAEFGVPRIAIAIRVDEDQSGNIFAAYTLQPNNRPDVDILDAYHPEDNPVGPVLAAMLESTAETCHNAVEEFILHHGWDAINNDYFAQDMDNMLKGPLGTLRA